MTHPSIPILRLPADPERQKIKDWLPANRGFYASCRCIDETWRLRSFQSCDVSVA